MGSKGEGERKSECVCERERKVCGGMSYLLIIFMQTHNKRDGSARVCGHGGVARRVRGQNRIQLVLEFVHECA